MIAWKRRGRRWGEKWKNSCRGQARTVDSNEERSRRCSSAPRCLSTNVVILVKLLVHADTDLAEFLLFTGTALRQIKKNHKYLQISAQCQPRVLLLNARPFLPFMEQRRKASWLGALARTVLLFVLLYLVGRVEVYSFGVILCVYGVWTLPQMAVFALALARRDLIPSPFACFPIGCVLYTAQFLLVRAHTRY